MDYNDRLNKKAKAGCETGLRLCLKYGPRSVRGRRLNPVMPFIQVNLQHAGLDFLELPGEFSAHRPCQPKQASAEQRQRGRLRNKGLVGDRARSPGAFIQNNVPG